MKYFTLLFFFALVPLLGAAQPLDIEIRNEQLTCSGNSMQWTGALDSPGRYQLWITYYCENKNAEATLTLNGQTKTKSLQYMGVDAFVKFYLNDGSVVSADALIDNPERIEPYAFREYWGTFDLAESIAFSLKTAGANSLRIDAIEFQKERPFNPEMEPLLFSAIDYYNYLTTPDGFVRNVYQPGSTEPSQTSSIASCGMGLMAYSIDFQLGRNPEEARQKALNTLRLFNNKHPTIQPQRHRTGYRHHFINVNDASSRSEFSTIDTAILVSGSLMARNTFNSPEITREADELWNSIDWSAAVYDVEEQAFHMTGKSIDGEHDAITILYSEYLMLAWLCQKAEDENGTGRQVMPQLDKLTKSVYRGRVILSGVFGDILPSFHVQFPFYMTDLCNDELLFSYTAAQAWGDRTVCTEKFNDRTAWGVSPGATPKRGYSVDEFHERHEEQVVTPRIIAGFMPVYPVATDDLTLLFNHPERRMDTRFGTIIPRWSPAHPGWQSNRLPGVDFSSLMFGMAAYHPDLGLDFFRKKLTFTFNQPIPEN